MARYEDKFFALVKDINENEELQTLFASEDYPRIFDALIDRGFSIENLRDISSDKRLAQDSRLDSTISYGFWF